MKTYVLPEGSEVVIHDDTLHRWRKTLTYTLVGGNVVIIIEK